MALSKPGYDFFGFTTDVYVKIHGTSVFETGSDYNGKLYQARILLNWYTNDTKSHQFSQTEELLDSLRENELVLPEIYSKLASLEKFSGFIEA